MRRENFYKAIHQKANAGQRYMRIPFPSGDGGGEEWRGRGAFVAVSKRVILSKIDYENELVLQENKQKENSFSNERFCIGFVSN